MATAYLIQRVLGLARYLSAEAEGQGMAEYGLILALVAVVVIVALTALGGNVSSTVNSVAGAF